MGLIIGVVVGIFAGYDIAGIGTLGMSTAAVMKIMPKMVAMFMEGLMPVAEAAKEFTSKRLNGRQVNIGMDAALTVGHPTVMSTSLLLVPISLAIALVLPGNKVLPFGDLAFFTFGICLMIPYFKGNIVRAIIGCSLYLVTMLYMSTWLAPTITEVFALANYDVGTTGLVTSVLCGIWPAGLFVIIANYLGIVGVLGIGVVVIVLMAYFKGIRSKKAVTE